MQASHQQAIHYLEKHLEEFWKQRKEDSQLRSMDLEEEEETQLGVTNALNRILIIKGRKDTPYQNKVIKIRVEFPLEYPVRPPKMFCLPLREGQTLLHANVYQDNGQICHPLLQPGQKAGCRLSLLFLKIGQLLYSPNFDNAANIVLADLWKGNQELYWQKISQNAGLLQPQENSSCSSSED